MATFTKTNIANLALRALAQSKILTNVDTDTTEPGLAIAAVYNIALETTLRAFKWPFAMVITDLQNVETDPLDNATDDNSDEWRYSYRMPSDCLFVHRILSGLRQDRPGTPIPYQIRKDPAKTITAITKANPASVTVSAAHHYVNGDLVYLASVGGMTQISDGEYTVGGVTTTTATSFTLVGIDSSAYSAFTSGGTSQGKALIMCDLNYAASGATPRAEIEYTALVTNPWLYTTDFVHALSLQIAYMAAPSVTNGDQFGLGKKCFDLFNLAISQARASAIQEERPDPPLESEFVSAR